MSKPSKETQEKKEVSNFYDMIIKIDSFRNLKKKESGHFGWDIIYGKDGDVAAEPRLPLPDEIAQLFKTE